MESFTAAARDFLYGADFRGNADGAMFWAHGISRQDGGKADGIHLLWWPPRHAGYSFDGFDIWRREQRKPRELSCYELTLGDLTALRTRLRAVTPHALIALRYGKCPAPPPAVPDQPWRRDRPAARPPLSEAERERNRRLAAAMREARRPGPAWRALLRDERAESVRRLLETDPHAHDPVAAVLSRAVAAGAERPAPTHDAPHVAAPPPARVHPGAAVYCLVYEFGLRRPCYHVSIRFTPYGGLAAAFRGEKALDARAMTQNGTQAQVEFAREDIDRVLIWVAVAPRGIEICCRSRLDDKEGWEDAKLIARNIQFPLQTIEPSVDSVAEEHDLAKSRLLPGEALGPGQFGELSEAMNEALKHAGVSPVHVSWMARSTPDQDFVEIKPWATGMALSLEAGWRRTLGLGFLDKSDHLVPGRTYDYRIVGRFRRRDTEERLLGFHTLPLGTPLPRSVHLGGVLLDFGGARDVVAHPPVPASGLGHGFRKGVRLAGRTTLAFPEPVTRVVLELEPADADLSYRALSGGLIPGLPAEVDSGPVPAAGRAELRFPDAVVRLELTGKALLYGFRLQLVAQGDDPEEVVAGEAIVPGIRYEPTAPPDPPPVLGTVNLQEPPLTGDAAVTTQRPPQLIGFKLHWLPPLAASSWPPGWWAPDIPAAPPSDITGFDVERRRVDVGGGWEPFDTEEETGLGALVGAARGGRSDPQPVRPGDELLAHFPEIVMPTPPVPVLADLEDVLLSRAKPDGPPPGSLHQYRIRSVDAIGRRSLSATVGSVVRLEKHLPPPRPTGPPVPANDTRPVPRGVRARLIQDMDPTLSEEDRARLAGRANAVVIEWAWGNEEREMDPWAREFRLYWQPEPPDIIHGEFTGAATLTGGLYHIHAELSRAVSADQFQGEFVVAGGHAFRIAGHDAGASVGFRFDPPALAITPPPVPGPGRFRLRPALEGEELRPGGWQERTAIVPIDARTVYEFVFPHVVGIDADHAHLRVWAGVSAADDQSYVPDELPAAMSNGGRPGNEGSIVPAVAEGRWLGRPALEVPPPLPDVPEIVVPEVPGEEVDHDIDLPALLPGVLHPPGSRFAVERLSGADLVAAISARPDDTVEVLLPDATARIYAPANPGDRAALLAQIRSGEAARIENRFLMDIAIQLNDTPLARLWRRARPEPVGFAAVSDRLPNKAERFLYRVRAVDAAGHVSAGAAFVPRVFRVPSRRLPGTPRLVRALPQENQVRAVLEAGARFDVTGVLLFSLVEDAGADDATHLDKPQLLRVPNRRDLYPDDGIRLRLADGTLLSPQFGAVAAAAVAGSVLTWTIDLASGHDKRVTLWAAAVTRDGVPSTVAGPMATTTAPAPPVVPALVVTVSGGRDQASWPAAAADLMLRLERSLDAGASWQPVSSWMPGDTTGHELPAGPAGRRYRLLARRGTRDSTGPSVAPA